MEIDILKINRNKKDNFKDIVIEEIPLTIYLNDKELLTLSCSPDNLKELSIGFLFSVGLVKKFKEIKDIIIDSQKWASYVTLRNNDYPSEFLFKRLYTSGCGRGAIFYNALDQMHRKQIVNDFKISDQKIFELMKSFEKKSVTYRKTGGVHSAALSDSKDILIFKEDIGRHNAIDKVIGEALMRNLSIKDLIVLTSGRISSDVMFKIQKMDSCLVISRSAPTDQAVKLAKSWNVTLVGFARGQRMNVYTAKERVI
ncbi:MAG: formate dehydrogenase accessory sulfurtransferase FdhD [Candidatus Omnitrophica bacterium]|nr:formate dehydrogenase accessory sulfurtransferase FdhD [Candidatus Omnitrophota bacterium]